MRLRPILHRLGVNGVSVSRRCINGVPARNGEIASISVIINKTATAKRKVIISLTPPQRRAGNHSAWGEIIRGHSSVVIPKSAAIIATRARLAQR